MSELKLSSKHARRLFVNMFHAGKLSFVAIQNDVNDSVWFTGTAKETRGIGFSIFDWGLFGNIFGGNYKCYFSYNEYEYEFYFPRLFSFREYAIANHLKILAKAKFERTHRNDLFLKSLAEDFEGGNSGGGVL